MRLAQPTLRRPGRAGLLVGTVGVCAPWAGSLRRGHGRWPGLAGGSRGGQSWRGVATFDDVGSQAVARHPVRSRPSTAGPARAPAANATVEPPGLAREPAPAVLDCQIGSVLRKRVGSSISNVADRLGAAQPDLAQQLVRDP